MQPCITRPSLAPPSALGHRCSLPRAHANGYVQRDAAWEVPRTETPVKRNAKAEIQFCLQGRDPLSSPARLRGCNLAPPTCIAAQASTMTRTGAAHAGQIHPPLMRERGKTSFPPPLFSPPSHGLPSPQTIVTGATRSPVRHDQKVSKLWHKTPQRIL